MLWSGQRELHYHGGVLGGGGPNILSKPSRLSLSSFAPSSDYSNKFMVVVFRPLIAILYKFFLQMLDTY